MSKQSENIELNEDLRFLSLYKQSKDQRYLGQFFKKYMGLLLGVCIKYLGDEEKAKDAVMDIYEQLVTKVIKYEIAYPKSWLYTLCKNHCYEILRSEKRVLEKESDAKNMYSEEIFHLYNEDDKEEKLNGLENCVEGLEMEQKQAIKWFYLEMKTYKEVTDLMNISWNRARSLIQNGRRNLKICLEKKHESLREK